MYNIIMRQQQAINKYVEMIKRYDKKKHPHKLPSPKEIFSLNSTQSSFFKKYVQQKIKNKIKEIRLIQSPEQPTLTTLQFDPSVEQTLKKGRRKFEVYQQQVERRITLEKQQENTRQKDSNKDKYRDYQCFPQNESKNDRGIEPKAKTLPFRDASFHEKSTTSHNFKKAISKSETITHGKKLCELDGTIFHFQKQSEYEKPQFPFYRGMFHHKDSNERAAIYSLLKAIPPVTIKSKLIKQGGTEDRSFARRKLSRMQSNNNMEELPTNTNIQSLTKSKLLKHIQMKERTSLQNVKQAKNEISAWEINQ